jgi:hypothetical protein
MSTFQIALLLLGAVVLLALVGQGIWASRRNLPRQADPSARAQPKSAQTSAQDPSHQHHGHDGAGEQQRREPSFEPSDGAQGEASATFPGGAWRETVHHPDGPDGGADSTLTARADGALSGDDMDFEVSQTLHSLDRWLALDALIDAIAPIEIEGLVSAQAAWAALPATRRVGTKPFMIEGLNAQRGEWESLRKGQQYSAFQAGIQLANRLGPLNEIEFSEFVMKTQRFSDAVGGEVEFTDMLEEVSRGKELDAFASEHDAQLIFQIKAQRLAWSPGFVQQHAGVLGFVAGVIPGRMVIPAKTHGGPPILGLSFDSQAALADDPSSSAIRLLSLTLDVPQVEQSDEPFRRMWYVAQELAQSMEGTITDDQGYVLTSNALANIEQDLLALYLVLSSRDLAAGSPQARRLFS